MATINDAKKIIKTQINSLKLLTEKLSVEHNKILSTEFTKNIKNQVDELLKGISSDMDENAIIPQIKNTIQNIDKTANITAQKIIDLNQNFSTQNKAAINQISGLELPIEQALKTGTFSTTQKNKNGLINDLKTEGIFHLRETIHEIAEKLEKTEKTGINYLGKYLKTLTTCAPTQTEKELAINIVKTETLLYEISKNYINKPTKIKAPLQSWLHAEPDNEILLSNIIKITAKKDHAMAVQQVESLAPSVFQQQILKEELTSPDTDSFKRAKLAMKGVEHNIGSLIVELKTSYTDIDDTCITLYLNDAIDHLRLAKACFKNDVKAMEQESHMDTSSRELIDDKLWNYLRSDTFYEAYQEVKKTSKKMKK